ncbi:hypothetical protein T440DRAFT_128682 [Plenodomus tracheiphilus IPT5]|uniref:Uncharacterized protein n=1 Tax=Plenodomus tracheiphilus IPT5 TaxID=1408161 RepID=A0A6A7B570_9PLEO|nr:hypothetical protein T440DRAFT_128682 [Plenodomus tracheiphilus IPT5]
MPTEAERERIRAKCGKVLEDTRKAERSLILMQQKLEPLRLQEEALKQSADEKKREADAELLQYAASVCRELCDKVQNALPREIRDLIYSHFTGGEKVRICKSDSKEYSQIGYFESISESAHTRNDNTIDADHWWNPSFVGPDMVRELGEQYFRSSCFLVDSIDLDIMDRFRVHDQWKLGLLPASFIRSLNIQIRCYQYDFDNEWHLDDAGLDPFGKDFDAAALAVTNARLGEAECGYKWAIPKSVAGLLTRLESMCELWRGLIFQARWASRPGCLTRLLR